MVSETSFAHRRWATRLDTVRMWRICTGKCGSNFVRMTTQFVRKTNPPNKSHLVRTTTSFRYQNSAGLVLALMRRAACRLSCEAQCAERRWNEELGLSATQWHAGRSHGTSAKTSWHRREGVKLHSRTRTLGWSYVIARYVARRAVHRRSGYYPGRTVVSG